nr:cyclase dehydrase [Rhizobium sp. Q54]
MNHIANAIQRSDNPRVIETGPSSLSNTDRLTRNLGWFSIGLGIAELVAARSISRAIGMEGSENLIRAFGVREIASGMLTLSLDKKAGLYSRVAGDALDLAVLSTALKDDNPKRGNAALAFAMVAGVTLLDVAAALGTRQQSKRDEDEAWDYSDRSGFPQGVDAARREARQEKDGQPVKALLPSPQSSTPEHRI